MTVRRKNQLTLPADVSEPLHIGEGDEAEFAVGADSEGRLRGLAVVPAEQRWFWTEEWQEGEREVSREIATGDVAVHGDADAMFTELEQ
ncbi:AbrB/MazE/SpoVT family DNA-binding domain-containing protein [Actinorugispora endophytica]|uniref:AbrB/MazE/SpoVT family DNA-binding domain-containing protein n=1 Tax=Actinorugispora endophytica TaxID=1605990 RepID=UPI001FB78A95|nr:AbrB/MazE/SpoVT family DNA-binding domain-containing protein [Actinorugispora endophytica]